MAPRDVPGTRARPEREKPPRRDREGLRKMRRSKHAERRTLRRRNTMPRAFILALALLITSACAPASAPAVAAPSAPASLPSPTAAPVVAPYEISSAGRLRVAVIPTDVGIAWKDAASGELSGVNVDIARALARRFGVDLQLVDMATYPAMAAALKAGTIDMVLVTPTPEREVDLD